MTGNLSDPPYLLEKDADLYHPQTAAGSPWSPTMMHGGPVNALIAMAAEALAREASMQVSRLTIDILKPVPMAGLRVTNRVLRQGKRMAVVDTFLTIEDKDEPVAAGRAVLLAPEPDNDRCIEDTRPAPTERRDIASRPWIPADILSQLPPGLHEHIQFHPSPDHQRPVSWVGADVGFSAERPMSSLEKCATLTDMTTVLAMRLQQTAENGDEVNGPMGLMNTNTSLHLSRAPVGDWYCFADQFIRVAQGYGVAECILYDEQGCIGRSVQNLIVNG